jgi:hypothetical protein
MIPHEKAATGANRAASNTAFNGRNCNTQKAGGVDVVLSRLDRVKRTGADRWIACCPAHDDRGPSLSIREIEDGRVLLHCFAGCDVSEILAALSLEIGDLFPRALGENLSRERRPFPAADILRCISFEALVVATSVAAILGGEQFTEEERERLFVAIGRLQMAANMGAHHG